MSAFFHIIPDLEASEFAYIQQLTNGMNEQQLTQFALMYKSRRKDPQMILILTLVGLFFFAGIQRFVLGKIGTGILWFFTGGLLFIGTIVDLINYKSLTNEYNEKQAYETAQIMRTLNIS